MEKKPEAKPAEVGTKSSTEPVEKPKKTGLIVAIVTILAVVVIGAVAAVAIINPFGPKQDAVPAALAKLFSEGAPKLVATQGEVTVTTKEAQSPFAAIAVKFNAGINGDTGANYTNAKITATFQDEKQFSFDADEIYVPDGDLYLRLSNIADALSNYKSEQNAKTVMPSSSDSVLDFIEVFEVIDEEWIHIDKSTFSSVTGLTSIDSPAQCLIDAAGNMKKYGDNFKKLYEENPFVTYSTNDLELTQKKDPLYLLGFDAEKMTGFINGIGNSGLANEMLACMDEKATINEISVDQVKEMVDALPIIYVEIDSNNNFTRVYLSLATEDNEMEAIADISLYYPEKIDVKEPEVYIELDKALSKLLTMFYGEDVYDFTKN